MNYFKTKPDLPRMHSKIFDWAKMFQMSIKLVFNQIQEHRLNSTNTVLEISLNFSPIQYGMLGVRENAQNHSSGFK